VHPNGSHRDETENFRCTTATDVKARKRPERDIRSSGRQGHRERSARRKVFHSTSGSRSADDGQAGGLLEHLVVGDEIDAEVERRRCDPPIRFVHLLSEGVAVPFAQQAKLCAPGPALIAPNRSSATVTNETTTRRSPITLRTSSDLSGFIDSLTIADIAIVSRTTATAAFAVTAFRGLR
jgi:hypothetical protein